MSSCAMSIPPREPCMTAAAAITPRGTAVSRSSMTSATNKLVGDEIILLVAVVPDVGIPVLLIRFVGGVRPFANTILYGGLIPPRDRGRQVGCPQAAAMSLFGYPLRRSLTRHGNHQGARQFVGSAKIGRSRRRPRVCKPDIGYGTVSRSQ